MPPASTAQLHRTLAICLAAGSLLLAAACGEPGTSLPVPGPGDPGNGGTLQYPNLDGDAGAGDGAAWGPTNGGPTPGGPSGGGGHLLSGQVLAPEGTIPISGALVYLTTGRPAPIPQETYCDRCVTLPQGTPYTTTGPDGRFQLEVGAGTFNLVVQKGAFRRVRSITVDAPEQQLPPEVTTLPGRRDADNGDEVPRMAIVSGAWDHIEVSLGKLGLAQLSGFRSVDRATAAFDVFENTFPPDFDGPRSPYRLLRDPALMGQYHILFIPCSGSSGADGPRCDDYQATEPEVQRNLQEFVKKGGKLYVTDYSYEYVRQPFPGFVEWTGQTEQVGSACMGGAYNAPARAADDGMRAWLEASGITAFDVEQNWTSLERVMTAPGTDENGNAVDITPKVWVNAMYGATEKPVTVSFDQGCGRVLFSTYHTEALEDALMPQERALMYVLLEIAVCIQPRQQG